MTQEEMNILVPQKLREIETQYGVTVLYAAESGSRAWGFASPDSDFDVRFIYKRPQKDYLRLNPPRDVIELPIDDTWDVSGWDLDKALKLLYKSNPSLYEWLGSPICYASTGFEERLRPLMAYCFSEEAMLRHYLSMARSNIRSYLQGEAVRPKKYMYALRPLLACRWILEKHCPPPVPFFELAAAVLPEELRETVDRLVGLKISGPEALEISHIAALDAYIMQSSAEIADMHEKTDKKGINWQPLNAFFLAETEAEAADVRQDA